jgi:hypothetical protein
MSEMKPEVIERMVALVRAMGGNSSFGRPYQDGETIQFSSSHYDTARAIVTALPVPVDPDLIEARRISISFKSGERISSEILAGERDSEEAVQAILVAIKRGRELAATPA